MATMRCRLSEQLKQRKQSFGDLERETGIRKATLLALDKGTAATVRLEHIDALCTYFQMRPGDLIAAEPVPLPLAHDIRPDRRKEEN